MSQPVPIIRTEPAEVPERHAQGWLHTSEALVALVAAGLCAVIPCGAAAIELYLDHRRPAVTTAALSAILLGGVAAEVLFLQWMKRAYDLRQHPLPPRLALQQFRWPLPLRPVIAAWWLAHAAGALLIADYIWQHAEVMSRHVDDRALVATSWVLRLLMLLGGTYASNLYILLTVGSLRPGSSVVWLLWRWRFAWDVLAAVALSFMPPLLAR